MTTPGPTAKHFSMIRGFHLADLLTLGNAACGTASVLLAMRYVGSGSLADFLWAAALRRRRSCSTCWMAGSRVGGRPIRRWGANSTRSPT